MTKDEALKLAMEAMEITGGFDVEINAIKGALAQHDSVQAKPEPEQEPVAIVESVATVVSESGNQEITMSWWHEPALPVGTKLYTTPPQRKPLTPDQVFAIADQHPVEGFDPEIMAFARAIEAAHGIKE